MVGGAKRKNEMHATKASKASKVEIKSLKNNTKEQLITKLQTLQIENEVLREQNEAKTEKIDELEQKIEILQNKGILSNLETISSSVQTEDMNRMFCVECEYPAEDIFDLGEHMYEVHAELNDVYSIACHHCGNHFKTKSDLMIHRKKHHEERVSQCSFFIEGKCTHGDECWYSHKSDSRKVLTEFKCKTCEEVFKFKSEFMKHRRAKHIESVPLCRDASNGRCQFGKIKCWFNHEEDDFANETRYEENGININQEVIDKIFDMMENVTKRIMMIENNL